MSQFRQTIAVLLAIGFAYVWLTTPSLEYYSLQAFALSTLGFFLSKRLSQAKLWHIMPEKHSFEIVFISFAVTILIGSTGNAGSIFYPFAYIHLFFLVMTTRQTTAILGTLAIMLVHYALEPTLTSSIIIAFTTLPIMLVLFLFARRQYDDAKLQHKINIEEEKQLNTLATKEHTLESFVTDFLQPKLEILQDLLETAMSRNEPVNQEVLDTQIQMLASESKKIISRTNSQDNKTSEEKK